MQEEAFCGSEGGEERSNVHRDGAGRDQTSEMCQWTSLLFSLKMHIRMSD